MVLVLALVRAFLPIVLTFAAVAMTVAASAAASAPPPPFAAFAIRVAVLGPALLGELASRVGRLVVLCRFAIAVGGKIVA